MRHVTFKNREEDLTTLGNVCRDLEERGVPPHEAAAYILADMASQAMMKGVDGREAIDALHKVITAKQKLGTETGVEVHQNHQRGALTERQAEELKQQVKFLQNFLLYWDMVLCVEIQRLAYGVLDRLTESGLYKHELKKFANKLVDEARKLQMRIKDNDRILVLKWCRRIDSRCIYAGGFFDDGGSVVSKLVLAYKEKFKRQWETVRLDCRNVAKHSNTSHQQIVSVLFEIEALTNTGIELFDVCVKKMKQMVMGHGKSSIIKSTHHESMRNATHGLLRKFTTGELEMPDVEFKYAKEHLAALQHMMVNEGTGDFFQSQFDSLGSDFVLYMLASMRLGIENGHVGVGAIRNVYDRLGTKKKVRKFFGQLKHVPVPEDCSDIFDMSDAIVEYGGSRSEIDRFRKMCEENGFYESDEPDEIREARIIRQQARKNKGMLPDDILRVMIGYYKTKTALIDHLEFIGYEVKPTLKRVKKMKISELKQL